MKKLISRTTDKIVLIENSADGLKTKFFFFLVQFD